MNLMNDPKLYVGYWLYFLKEASNKVLGKVLDNLKGVDLVLKRICVHGYLTLTFYSSYLDLKLGVHSVIRTGKISINNLEVNVSSNILKQCWHNQR